MKAWLAIVLASCGQQPAAKSSETPSPAICAGIKATDVAGVATRVQPNETVAVVGRVTSRPGTCAEVECPGKTCCGCAFEAVLVGDLKPTPEEAITLVGAKCEQRADCTIVCDPPAGTRAAIVGKVLRTNPDVAIQITKLCRL